MELDCKNQTSSNNTLPFVMKYCITTTSFISIIIFVFICISIIGNIMIINTLNSKRRMKTVRNHIIMSLVVADIAVALVVMPLSLLNEISQSWFLGVYFCAFWLSIDVIVCTSSILHLMFLALDRYWSITNVQYTKSRPIKKIITMISASWALAVLIAVPIYIDLFNGKLNSRLIASSQCIISSGLLFTIYSTGGAFFLPVIIMIILYIKIFIVARKCIRKLNTKCNSIHTKSKIHKKYTSMELNSTNKENSLSVNHQIKKASTFATSITYMSYARLDRKRNSVNPWVRIRHVLVNFKIKSCNKNTPNVVRISTFLKKAQKRESKARLTLLIISTVFLVCWTPFFMLALISGVCAKCKIPEIIYSIFLWLGYLNSMMNPIIFAICNEEYRTSFKIQLKKLNCLSKKCILYHKKLNIFNS
ncbi:D(2) dopamine receptor A [Intoshia linei]|uniref:D(2) dopamine receptor A n=1 Tax=Intoshia linei TaxID=1819745 RepID=A0A177B9U0_9BILA|nr:D(2) dopamine receptor A [Intoshia linei]